jgi:sugar-specific transcriptional regulator TrmB
LPRATVYQVLDRLVQKNLVLKIDKENILTYFPESPEKLITNLNKQTRDLRKKLDLAEKLVPHLDTLKNPHKKDPQASYFE